MTILKTQEEVARWWARDWNPDGRISDQRFARNATAFRDLFTHVVRCPYYSTWTAQQVFGLTMRYDADIAAVQREVEILLSHIRPCKFSKNLVIYEHTEAAGGVYELRVGKIIRLTQTTHGKTRDVERFASLEEALIYIRTYYPVYLASEIHQVA